MNKVITVGWKNRGDNIVDKNGEIITVESIIKGPRGRIWEIEIVDKEIGTIGLYNEISFGITCTHYVNAECMVNYEVLKDGHEIIYGKKKEV